MKTARSCSIFPRFVVASLFVAGIFMAAPEASAQIKKCVDGSGKVVGYGSDCPAGTREEATGIRNAPSSPATVTGRSIAEQDADFRKRQMEKQAAQAKADKAAANNEERARACDSARSYLKTLQSGMRIVRTDPNTGERVYLSETDYPKEMAAAQHAVDANCK